MYFLQRVSFSPSHMKRRELIGVFHSKHCAMQALRANMRLDPAARYEMYSKTVTKEYKLAFVKHSRRVIFESLSSSTFQNFEDTIHSG